jgi:hypothetical protein
LFPGVCPGVCAPALPVAFPVPAAAADAGAPDPAGLAFDGAGFGAHPAIATAAVSAIEKGLFIEVYRFL